MKKAICLLAILAMSACTSNREYKLERPNRMIEVEYRSKEKAKKTVVINSVTFSNEEMTELNKVFGRSVKSIVQNEFSNNNFRVLAREELDAVSNEIYFNENIANIKRRSAFMPSDYIVNMKIVNASSEFSGVMIPIVFNKLTHAIEFSVELTIVNVHTGELIGSNGNGRTSYNTQNLMIFIGDINVPVNIPLENALRMAIRDAILKANI
ncbi:MAG: CsgG/HfaB family protein [Paraclostridium sp.]